MSQAGGNVQETFLNLCRKERVRCIVYLVNGVQLRGQILAFDHFTLLLEDEQKQQIVYKHAVTTVQPMRRIPLPTAVERAAAESLPAADDGSELA